LLFVASRARLRSLRAEERTQPEPIQRRIRSASPVLEGGLG
jgi:hypothetical protein